MFRQRRHAVLGLILAALLVAAVIGDTWRP